MSYVAYPANCPEKVIARRGGSLQVDYDVVCRHAREYSAAHRDVLVLVRFSGWRRQDLIVMNFMNGIAASKPRT